jgi:hypothetical protein
MGHLLRTIVPDTRYQHLVILALLEQLNVVGVQLRHLVLILFDSTLTLLLLLVHRSLERIVVFRHLDLLEGGLTL